MRKLLFILSSLIILTVILYLIVPAQLKITKTINANCNLATANRVLTNVEYINTWWPINKQTNKAGNYKINDVEFKFNSQNDYNVPVGLQANGNIVNSNIVTNMLTQNNLLINWNYTINSGNMPWQKLQAFLLKIKINKAVNIASNNLINTLNSTIATYGFGIKKVNLTDSTLIAIKDSSINYPTNTEIYGKVTLLQNYAKLNNATVVKSPMLNTQFINNKYFYMVALPVNKLLSNKGNIQMKRMLIGGNYLESDDIKGGYVTIQKAIQNFENYKTDYSYSSPAIPFQSLITNRINEPDSTKWITKLYYPIF